jgi:hypothetical protein
MLAMLAMLVMLVMLVMLAIGNCDMIFFILYVMIYIEVKKVKFCKSLKYMFVVIKRSTGFSFQQAT